VQSVVTRESRKLCIKTLIKCYKNLKKGLAKLLSNREIYRRPSNLIV